MAWISWLGLISSSTQAVISWGSRHDTWLERLYCSQDGPFLDRRNVVMDKRNLSHTSHTAWICPCWHQKTNRWTYLRSWFDRRWSTWGGNCCCCSCSRLWLLLLLLLPSSVILSTSGESSTRTDRCVDEVFILIGSPNKNTVINPACRKRSDRTHVRDHINLFLKCHKTTIRTQWKPNNGQQQDACVVFFAKCVY